MMLPITLGTDLESGRKINLEPDIFRTHFHLLGATGAGKTTAVHTMLRPIMLEPAEPACVFIIDPMGNLSHDLLRWMVSGSCTEDVRRRLVYIEPAREDVVLPFNPLLFGTEAEHYYQVARAVDLVLRAWESQDISQMPRLRQWAYKAFYAAAAMGLPIAMCRYLLHPGTPEHAAILNRLPEQIRNHWLEILNARGSEAVRILESTRNRLDPFFQSVILRRMFGYRESRFDVQRMIRQRRIVIVNVAAYGKLAQHDGRTIGSLIVNEIFEKAFHMATTYGRAAVEPTYVLMDEFQHFISPDIEDSLPTVRQMGLRLILAHQSFHQLEQGSVDLTGMIWQARSRLMFASDAEDADRLAHELGTRTFDPQKVKDIRTTRKQLIVGYRKEWMDSMSDTSTHGDARIEQESQGESRSCGESLHPNALLPTEHVTKGSSGGKTSGRTSADSFGQSRGKSQTNVPIHETFEEVANITFKSFDEHCVEWGQRIRKLRTGEAFGIFANDPALYSIRVDHKPLASSAAIEDAKEALIEKNFQEDFFVSAAEADREADDVRRHLLQSPPIVIQSLPQPTQLPAAGEGDQSQSSAVESAESLDDESPFRD